MTFSLLRKTAVLLFSSVSALLTAAMALAADAVYPPLVNWTAPATWSSHTASRGVSAMSDITNPMPFIGTTPCRQYDSRNTTPLATATNRAVTLTGAPCGLPTAALAVSVNITVFNITGASGNGVFLVGTTSPPTTAWINFPPTETQRGNAGVVVLTSGAIIVRVEQGSGSVDFTVDVNGYYTGGNLATDRNLYLTGSFDAGGVIEGINSATFNSSSGVFGFEAGITGQTYGVYGATASTSQGAAGVVGIAHDGIPTISISVPTNQPSGVLGVSKNHPGVEGDGYIVGVRGRTFSTTGSGTFVNLGILGLNTAISVYGVFANADYGGMGVKFFIEPHPTDAGKVIRYVSLEGNEAGTYFRGTSQIVNGTAEIPVPEDFRTVTDDEGLTVQLTPIGAGATMFIASEDLNHIVVRSNRDVKFHYQVNGIRRAYKDLVPVVDGVEFMPNSVTAAPLEFYRPEIRRRLVSNGTYNADGSINMETAERLGWTKVWAEQAKPAEAKAIEKTPGSE